MHLSISIGIGFLIALVGLVLFIFYWNHAIAPIYGIPTFFGMPVLL